MGQSACQPVVPSLVDTENEKKTPVETEKTKEQAEKEDDDDDMPELEAPVEYRAPPEIKIDDATWVRCEDRFQPGKKDNLLTDADELLIGCVRISPSLVIATVQVDLDPADLKDIGRPYYSYSFGVLNQRNDSVFNEEEEKIPKATEAKEEMDEKGSVEWALRAERMGEYKVQVGIEVRIHRSSLTKGGWQNTCLSVAGRNCWAGERLNAANSVTLHHSEGTVQDVVVLVATVFLSTTHQVNDLKLCWRLEHSKAEISLPTPLPLSTTSEPEKNWLLFTNLVEDAHVVSHALGGEVCFGRVQMMHLERRDELLVAPLGTVFYGAPRDGWMLRVHLDLAGILHIGIECRDNQRLMWEEGEDENEEVKQDKNTILMEMAVQEYYSERKVGTRTILLQFERGQPLSSTIACPDVVWHKKHDELHLELAWSARFIKKQ